MNNPIQKVQAPFQKMQIAGAVSKYLCNRKVMVLLPLCFAHAALAASDDNQQGDSAIKLEPMVIIQKKPMANSLNTTVIGAEAIVSKQSAISDTAKLLEDTPGVSLYSGGGVSSLPVIHGLNDDRVKIDVNGMTITSACANHMNPPLSYIDRSNIGKIIILSGISPVSMGGDSIGGTISVQSADPVFAEPGKDILIDGSVSGFYRSNRDAFGGSIAAGIANKNLRLDYTGSHTESMNYKDGNGDIVKSSSYENQNHAAALSFKHDNHLVVIRGGQQHVPFENFPNARMDLTNNDTIFGNIMHKGTFDWGNLESRFFYESTQHSMNIGQDKQAFAFAPPNNLMPMDTRGRNLGYKIQAEIPLSTQDTLRVGNEYIGNTINDWWSSVPNVPGAIPRFMMAPETFTNINNGARDRIGTFAEWESNWTPQWKTMLGLRYDHTNTNTGNVQPYNPLLLNNAGVVDASRDVAGDRLSRDAANAFNAQNHERNTDTFDVTAMLQFTPNDMSQYEFGYARKNRAPNLYERYLWGRRPMDMGMNGWFGDGNGYVGNMNLKPETAHTVSFTAAFDDLNKDLWQVKATPYFTYVENFIDADRCSKQFIDDTAACTAANQTATNKYVYLQYANHDARLWGVDVSGTAKLYSDKTLGDFSTHSIMSYVRGERMDGGNLYHMMPFNAKLSLDHKRSGWQSAFEMQFVDSKSDVQAIRNETQTPSYILLNARTGYEWTKVRLDVGLDNVLDKQYYNPLGGSYLGDQFGMNPTGAPGTTVPWGRNLAGMGRSVYVGLSVKY
ncbi:MAG: TonB-dependent receptor [Methylococcaceae bacterium]